MVNEVITSWPVANQYNWNLNQEHDHPFRLLCLCLTGKIDVFLGQVGALSLFCEALKNSKGGVVPIENSLSSQEQIFRCPVEE